GVPPLSWHLDHTGTLTGSVALAATVFSTVAGERAAPALAMEDRPSRLDGLRIGVLGGWFEVTEPEVGEITADAVSVLRDLGAQIVPVRMPLIEQINPDAVKRVLVDAESAALHDPDRPGYGDGFGRLIQSGRELR